MAANEDINELTTRFTEVHGSTDKPLFEIMKADLESGRRSKASIMADLEEAAEHRRRQSLGDDDKRLYIASL